MGKSGKAPHRMRPSTPSQPYHVTVFTTPTSRARKFTTSDTPSTFEDAAKLARKSVLVARIRNTFLIILTIASALFALTLLTPRLHPYSQEGLPNLKSSLQHIDTIPARHKILGYKREAFGADWAKAPASSCNTRQVVIFSQSPDASDCTMESTELFDPYSQSLIPNTNIEVDHIFPLSAAWDHGAYAWDDTTRKSFANDPLNLVATSRTLNQSKSDSLPSEWMPPNPAAQCWYAERVAAVAAGYSLTLSETDLINMKRQCQLGIPFM